MLRCPKCGRTYETDTQKFCTHDGGRLMPDDQTAASQAPTAYDLNQTIRTDPFDPEATVTRMPDLNKTITSAPTTEIRAKETGPASAPPPAYSPEPPQPPPQPPLEREMPPTIAFNQPLPVPPPTPPPPQTPPQQQQQYYPQQPPASGPSMSPPAQAHTHQQPQQYAPAHYQQPAQPAAPSSVTAPARRKSSRMPLIIALVAIVLVGAAAAWYFLIYKKGESVASGNANAANLNANTSTSDNANTAANTNTNETPPTPPPPPNATEFVNASAALDGKLAENYSDFSFYYPNSWSKDPKAGVAGASNFVKVERSLPPDFTQENFAVSWYESRGTFEADEAEIFPKLVESLKSRYANSFPEFTALSEGETSINGIKGYEFRFQSISKGTEKGDITLWGRVVFLPPGVEGKKNGIQLLMLTTSLAPELTGADDVGVRGELPVILNSFRMGNK